jgi:hypothetical protein
MTNKTNVSNAVGPEEEKVHFRVLELVDCNAPFECPGGLDLPSDYFPDYPPDGACGWGGGGGCDGGCG